jgi:hypothetical protein
MIIEINRAIGKAQKKITFVSRNKETLRAYQMREMALDKVQDILKMQ